MGSPEARVSQVVGRAQFKRKYIGIEGRTRVMGGKEIGKMTKAEKGMVTRATAKVARSIITLTDHLGRALARG